MKSFEDNNEQHKDCFGRKDMKRSKLYETKIGNEMNRNRKRT
jgi:hypothetical protein